MRKSFQLNPEDHIKRLKTLWEESALHIDTYGHHKEHMWSGKACCIMGAPRMIDNESSYSHISRNLLADMGYPETWNDVPERTKEEVVAALKECSKQLGAVDMERTFGPHWLSVVELITDVDNWDQSTYTDMEARDSGPTTITVDDYYTKSLASFMATVMTSGKTTKSVPFKNYFDGKYKELK